MPRRYPRDNRFRIVRRAVLVIVACAGAAAAALAEPPAPGTYRGTLGGEPISVCLGGDRPQFYREKVGKTADLEALPQPGAFLESDGVQGKLRDVLVKTMRAEAPECAERRLEAGFDGFTPWLGSDGLAFRLDETARAYAACDGDYVIPFVAMRPFIDPSVLADYDRFAAEAKRLARSAGPAPSPR
jgi:hypothetical protein